MLTSDDGKEEECRLGARAEPYFHAHTFSIFQSEGPIGGEVEGLSALPSMYRGELIVAMKFVPPPGESRRGNRKAKGMLMVLVKEAKNLVPSKGAGNADAFCKW